MQKYVLALAAFAAAAAILVVSASATGSKGKTIKLVHVQTSFSAPDNPSRPPAAR